MPLGWDDVRRIKRVEEMANKLGFMFAAGYSSYGSHKDDPSSIVLKPLGDAYPHYNRDAEIFVGTVESIECWLRGLEWARHYDELLKISNTVKRTEREQAEKNKQLMKSIKTGKPSDGRLGVFGDEEDAELEIDGFTQDELLDLLVKHTSTVDNI